MNIELPTRLIKQFVASGNKHPVLAKATQYSNDEYWTTVPVAALTDADQRVQFCRPS